MIGFPASPAIGDTHTYAGLTWEWTGVGWKKQAATSESSAMLFYEFDWSSQSSIDVVSIDIEPVEVEYV